MPEIKYVAGTVRRAAQHIAGTLGGWLPAGDEPRCVEVSLDPSIEADALPGAVERLAMVDADDISPGDRHRFEQTGRTGAEVDGRRSADFLEDARHVWLDVAHVVRGAERTDPRVEELDYVHAGVDLGIEVAGHDRRELLHQRVPGLWLAVHERLGDRIVPRRAALDEVARQRE